jgi:hypothetical protein
MKRIALIPLLLAIFFSVQSQKNVIGLGCNAIKLVPRISYERLLSNKIAVVIGLEKGKYNGDYTNDYYDRELSHLNGFGIEPEFRVYPFTRYKTAPLGPFVGTHFRYRWLTEHYNGYNSFTAKAKAYNFGINAGYKLKVDFLTFEFLFALGKSAGKWETAGIEYRDFEGHDLTNATNHMRFEVSIGFLFPYTSYQL